MAMTKRTTFTTISPLPAGISREFVVGFLHNHAGMIDLNPLIIERHKIDPPPHAAEEERRCVWWSMTDKISYLPGGMVTGEVTYTAAFNDLPTGIQTHSYAAMGTDILGRWTVNGSLPGEPPEPVELGIGAPRQGLYLREDVELRCNFMMTSFIKKTLKKAHGTLVDKLLEKAEAAGPGAAQGISHHRQHTASSVHSGSIHSNHSGNQATYPAPSAFQQQAPLYHQHRPQSRPGSATNSFGRATPPPRTASPYHRHSPAPSNGSNHNNSIMPEPLRVNKNRTPPGQTMGIGIGSGMGVQSMAWSNGRAASGQGQFRVPRADDGGFRAELE
ncbi:uncharacterized protein F4822DRAFT_319638 [Hypoxylon trugodes]|uniref:uncharacterized protein n=1 Tax=Hypoxylon trugodes TaxID=326681 RepID=UPI00219DCA2D|nr:uncharacterized protein F4822DRAFT_319638 [Hypoxylon trugodes]KAI1386545.1 hypothetical protein F4822DRAFT_319638 [Hypoxylon trugodes]